MLYFVIYRMHISLFIPFDFIDIDLIFFSLSFQERYYASLADEAGTKNLPSVLTKIREESTTRFMHNLKNYRQDKYNIIDDDTYEVISTDGIRKILC